ncbi:Cof-type HAD-IIB family hydrolase [Virgibacillus pantothenticus]|uniref:Cof-type HAD-IIB family hydrolase n=1 Tax=Virgibacillus pantothenticus TaxID=1473 RepID=UPI001C21F1A0|nr:Cof-type HAD-IIB family hydrolase [Virgibacillus pantothenticus]MBU8566772.1 Cof-type HAD-IIB family hydrolase [Virgibacillus pantothenticus]MBU8600355.1 Cof-type HAD-IIB family hydrolase [Virgibacillus pantothenticus]MBU8634928.1 Cof-type HAD-IIB family hydrolase [Virgibacillus pantothenticus]MBU8642492.1 Cof-type HAD-IIB family hydrolase [Virgibacillus pantothenticus]MBU8646640.1 Cof-type HAD-IIB family hydrolase [Virgibacillus pantothenticus]
MQTNRHLIALDLDGTLLTDKKEISPKTKQVVLKAMAEGHIVVIATGRPHRASIGYYENLGLTTPMVNFNGALIHHPRDKKWDALHSPMPIRTAHKIIGACYDLNVRNILAEVMDEVYLDQYDQAIIDIFHRTANDPPFTIGSLRNKLTEDPTSILIHPDDEHISTLRQHLDDFHADLIEHRKWGAPWNIIEIVRKGMNKAVGLQKIAHYFHIPQERIIAFGDEDNDLEMIDYAGVGVAMDNAIDELKAVSKYVTDSNEADGIANFLQTYLKLDEIAH